MSGNQSSPQPGSKPGSPDNSAGPVVDPLTAPWWAVSEVGSTAGAVAGYRWTIPAGAVQKDSRGYDTVTFELAPLVDSSKPATELDLFFFNIADGKASEMGGLTLMPVTYTVQSAPLPATPVTETPSFRPTFYTFTGSNVKDGNELGLVLVAKGAPTAAGFAWRLLDHAYDYTTDKPESSSDAMLANLTKLGQGAVLQAVGTASTSTFALYESASILFPYIGGVITYNFEVATIPNPSRSTVPAVVPGVMARDFTYDSAVGADKGWGTAVAEASNWGGAGQFSATAACSGNSAASSTPSVGAYIPVSYPVVVATGEGSGDCKLHFAATMVNAADFGFVVGLNYGFGGTLSDLIGAPGYSTKYSSIDTAPTVTAVGPDLVLDGAWGHLVMAGAAPQPS